MIGLIQMIPLRMLILENVFTKIIMFFLNVSDFLSVGIFNLEVE